MAWIESHTVLLRHRKVLQLASDLGLLPVYVMGHLHALWHSVLEQQENGDLSSWSDVMIAQAAAYSSEPKASSDFVTALRARKWLDETRIHDWIDYAGLFLIKKYSTSNLSRLRDIWKVHGYKYGKRDAKSLHRLANRKRTDSEPKANLPNLTKPNLTKPNLTKPKRESTEHAMPENWILTQEMIDYGKKKGMNPATITHEFEHCKEHHVESKFTVRGWAVQVWRTWALKWISFGSKQVTTNDAAALKAHRLIPRDDIPRSAMPDEVRSLVAQVGKGKDMPK